MRFQFVKPLSQLCRMATYQLKNLPTQKLKTGIVERECTQRGRLSFSIFYCGCKLLKSIHFIFECEGSTN